MHLSNYWNSLSLSHSIIQSYYNNSTIHNNRDTPVNNHHDTTISAGLSDMHVHSLRCLRLLGRGAEIVPSEALAVLRCRFPTFPRTGSNAADP